MGWGRTASDGYPYYYPGDYYWGKTDLTLYALWAARVVYDGQVLDYVYNNNDTYYFTLSNNNGCREFRVTNAYTWSVSNGSTSASIDISSPINGNDIVITYEDWC
jgi:hypothetical protein